MTPTQAPATKREPTSSPDRRVAGLSSVLTRLKFSRFSGIYLILLFILVFGLWVPDTFLTSSTLKNLLSQEAITAMLAIGLLFPLSVAAFDLSVGAMLGLSAMLSAWLIVDHHVGTVPVIAIVVGIGALVGMVNGAIVVFAGVDSFIATLGTSSVLLAATEKVSGGQYISGVGSSFGKLASPQPLGIPIVALYVVVLAVIVWYVLEHTPVGRRMHATGANPDASRLAGVAIRKLSFWSLVASAVIASLAGILLAAKLGSAAPEQGSSYLLPVFAAALLGTTQIHPGRVNVVGTVVAIVLLAVGIKGLQLAGAESWVTQLFNGVALLVAVSAASLSKKGVRLRWTRKRRRSTMAPGPQGPDTAADS